MADKKKILVVGDVMLDRYVDVFTTRNAQEADIPVWDKKLEWFRLGGAANVANNLAALNDSGEFEIYLAGIVGSNVTDQLYLELCASAPRFKTALFFTPGGSLEKTRYVDYQNRKIIFRFDNRLRFSREESTKFEMWFDRYVDYFDFDAVIFSDYDKGTITDLIVERVKTKTKLTVVDSKRKDMSIFRGCSILKVNQSEYSASHITESYKYVEDLFDYCVVTKGADGSELRICDKTISNDRKYVIHSETFPSRREMVVDVTGCGDTHTAALTFSFLKVGDIRSAVRFANEAAGSVVKKFGTSTPK